MDAGSDPLLVTNVTSNGYAMAAETATYVADRIDGKGNVVMFVFDAFPPVQVRGVVAERGVRQFPRHQDPRPRDARRRRWRHRRLPRQDGGDPRRQPDAGLASRRCGPPGTSRRSARCRPSRPPAARTRASSSPASTPTRRRARKSPRAAISKPPSRRISRASARPPPTPSPACSPARRIKQHVIYVPTKLITAVNAAQ